MLHLFMHGCNYVAIKLKSCLYEQTQIVASAASRVGGQ